MIRRQHLFSRVAPLLAVVALALPATTAGAAPTHDAGAGGIERTDAPAPGEGFVALTPTRILDTRDGLGRPGTSPVPQGGVVSLQVTGVAGVPAEGVDAVVVNVTGTQGTEDGNYVTVYPAGAERPTASNLNLDAGQTRPNLVVVKVGAEGRVDLFNFKGNLHLVADVAGYFPTGSDFTGMSPERILDTRKGLGRIGIDPVVQSETVDLQVAGVGGVPATGVTAVAMNVTATNVTEDGGYVTAYPAGAERPVASNLNLDAGQTRPNLVVVKVGTAGMVSLFNFKGRTDLIVDVAGYFTGDDVFVGTVPERILDTRAGIGRPGTDPLRQDESLRLQVSGVAGVPAADEVAAVVVNITAVRPSLDGGYVTAWPTGVDRPVVSNLNFDAGEIVPNLAVVKVGADGGINLFNFKGDTHLLVDLMGWLPAEAESSNGGGNGGGGEPCDPEVVLDIEDSIDVAGGERSYDLDVEAGQRLSFVAVGSFISQRLGWRLTGPGGEVFDGNDFVRVVDIATAEAYELEIYSRNDGTGSYELTIADVTDPSCIVQVNDLAGDPPPRFSAGPDAPVPGAGQIDVPGEYHRFDLTASAGQRLSFVAVGSFISQRLGWRLTGPGGEVFDGNDFVQVVEIETAGAYVLEIYSRNEGTGGYELTIADVTAPALVLDAETLPFEAREDAPVPGAGQIDVPGEYHRFDLTASAGQRLSFVAVGSFISQRLGWRLTGPGGEVFDGNDFVQVVDIATAGDYQLEIYSRNEGTGGYELTIADVTAPALVLDVGALPFSAGPDAPVPGAGQIDVPGEYHRFDLTASAGQRLSFVAMGSFISQRLGWRLTGPGGEVFDGNDFVQVVDIATAGDYQLEIYSRNEGTGDYELTIEDVS